jgi:hypothetical protein
VLALHQIAEDKFLLLPFLGGKLTTGSGAA